MAKPQPWSTADATDGIRRIARSDQLRLIYTGHAKERIVERDLIVGDLLYVLKNGFVHREAVASSQAGLFRYRVESRTPNSGNRGLAVIVIPDDTTQSLKIVTVMWDDE
jgi:hypothetical protein